MFRFCHVQTIWSIPCQIISYQIKSYQRYAYLHECRIVWYKGTLKNVLRKKYSFLPNFPWKVYSSLVVTIHLNLVWYSSCSEPLVYLIAHRALCLYDCLNMLTTESVGMDTCKVSTNGFLCFPEMSRVCKATLSTFNWIQSQNFPSNLKLIFAMGALCRVL